MLHISCNIGTLDLPDMYALSPWACGPRALGIHISGKSLVPMLQLLHIELAYIYSNCRKITCMTLKCGLLIAHTRSGVSHNCILNLAFSSYLVTLYK